jgi:uncharacterized membrane protein (DUF106 family)
MRPRTPVLASLLVLGAILFLIWFEPISEKSAETKRVAQSIDAAIWCLRHGDNSGTTSNLKSAQEIYLKLGVENVDKELDNRIKQMFENLSRNPAERGCHDLRKKILGAAARVGASLPLKYEHSSCLILLVCFLSGFLYAALLKVTVNWERVREIRTQIDEWRRKYNEARKRKDFKELHKLMAESSKLAPLHSELMMATLTKPLLFSVSLFVLLLILLGNPYSGWVVAWLPFGVHLPIYGYWTSCGVFSWLILSFGAMTSLWRKLLIKE